jgi:uncharacterized membrane-anchored protein YitT (DUF2179 family)
VSETDHHPESKLRHSRLEDAHALLIGTGFTAFGLVMLKTGGLVTGGLAGVALVVSYMTGWPTGIVFVVINLPFFLLASKRLGAAFTLKSLLALVLLAAFTMAIPGWIHLTAASHTFCAIFGGSVIGIGVLSLARHRCSIGGIGILALFLQEKRGLNAGAVQLAFDLAIIAGAVAAIGYERASYSIVSAVSLNLVMIAYHRPGRYAGY